MAGTAASGLTLIALAVQTWRSRATAVRRRVAFTIVGAAFTVNAVGATLGEARLVRDAEAVRARRESDAAAALAARVRAEGEALQGIAAAAVGVRGGGAAAFSALELLVAGEVDRAVILADSGRPVAWAGKLSVAIDSLPGPVGVVATPFHVVAYAIGIAGSRSAIATTLLHAARPADRIGRPLDAVVARSTGVTGFAYGGAGAAASVPRAVVLTLGDEAMLAARAVVPSADVLRHDARERADGRGALLLAVQLLLLLGVAWRRDLGLGGRFAVLGVAFGVLAVVPLSKFSAKWSLFDPTFYFAPMGGRFTANAGALALTSAMLLLGLLSALRAGLRPRSRTQALAAALLVALVGPFVLRDLARGVRMPAIGASVGLWLSWEVTLFLAAVTVLLLGVTAGQAALAGTRRGLAPWVAPAIAAIAALSTPFVLEAPGRLPALHPVLWVLAIGALAFTRRARTLVATVAIVAACGAVTLTWFSTVRERVQLAVADVRGLSSPDPSAPTLLARFAEVLDAASAPRSRVELLSRFSATELAGAELPTEIVTWAPDGSVMAELTVGRGPSVTAAVNVIAAEAARTGTRILREQPGVAATTMVLAQPHLDGSVTTVALAPRTALVAADAFGSLLGAAAPPAPEPPYALFLGDVLEPGAEVTPTQGRWSRDGSALHGDWSLAALGGAPRRIHAIVELRGYDALVTRGALLVLVDLAVMGAVWLLIVAADGAARRWWRMRRRDLLHSFRVRLSVALFAAFVVPSALLGAWSFQRVRADDRESRDLLVRETLRGVAASTDSVQLAQAAQRFDTPLFLYANGLLVGVSDPLLDALAPVGRLLPPDVVRTLLEGNDPTTGHEEALGDGTVRLGYRAVVDGNGTQWVLAAPARLDERALDRRRNDLAVFLLFALALGGIAALWASGAGARQLSQPIGALRANALALARGGAPPALDADPPVEFAPVFSAFRTMTGDLAESRAALETAERRLAATLRNVASGVIAVDDAGRVTFANPRAESILGEPLPAGRPLAPALGAEIVGALAEFLDGPEDEAGIELEREGRRLQVRAARLAAGARRAVITLDDVTDVARAERVLAWGEMARQVAHEIKNPLTPIRLGMQHLLRARRDGRVDFDRVLDENVRRVLEEIDRLDEIARAFSRYGTAPLAAAPAESTDVAQVARDVLELERMGQEGILWDAQVPATPVLASATARELREVLLNLLENARQARARRIALVVTAVPGGGAEVTVRDDGDGIAPELLERVFEPHFSTRTSGSGLGLAVSRRVVERWGGALAAESTRGEGTTLRLTLAPPPSA
ncbi:MAG: ATP-binding protein [Gemmatimonadaceae bacterium]|nr:ATP-binding protein [Gemmatimonadaceae bacterium]